MEKRKEKSEKKLSGHNKIDEHQNTNKQMLGFDEVNFEQKREPYREASGRSNNPGEVSDRWTENRI